MIISCIEKGDGYQFSCGQTFLFVIETVMEARAKWGYRIIITSDLSFLYVHKGMIKAIQLPTQVD